jgi:hypothetical protein
MDKRTSMGVIGNMGAYTQFESASAIRDAASNPGGLAGAGAGLAAGYQMANQMSQAMGAAQSGAANAAAPPPLPGGNIYFASVGGQRVGPLGLDELGAKIKAGEITGKTLVWKQGMSAWTAAESVGELGSLLGAVPPPLP